MEEEAQEGNQRKKLQLDKVKRECEQRQKHNQREVVDEGRREDEARGDEGKEEMDLEYVRRSEKRNVRESINAENIIYYMWDLSKEFYEYENLQQHQKFYEKELYNNIKNFFENLKKQVKHYKMKKKLFCLYAINYVIVIAF